MKKFFIVCFALLCCVVALVFFFKDQVATRYITQTLAKQLPGKFTLKGAKIAINAVNLSDISLVGDTFDIRAKKASLRFWFTKNLEPYLTMIAIEDGVIDLKNVDDFTKTFKRPNAQGPESASRALDLFFAPKKPVHYTLKNMAIRGASTDFNSDVSFSVGIVLYELGVARIKEFKVKEFNFKSKDFRVERLSMEQLASNKYLVKIPLVVIRDKQVKNLSIPLRISGDRLIVEKAGNRFFGTEADLEGSLDFSDYRNICFAINFHGCSFEKVLAAFVGDNKVTIEGAYAGKLLCCLEGGAINNIESYFYDTTGGLININDDKSLDFLRTYVDQKSYNALVDNLQKYRYNKGKITVQQVNQDLILKMHFESADSGERNVSINFHNVLGGAQ